MDDTANELEQKPRRAKGRVLNLYKDLCETPRERLDRLRMERPEYAHEVLSYAGRLDPMAEGVLLALVGQANSQREAYLNLDKEYVLDVLFGFSTDTYDVLGRVMESGDPVGVTKNAIQKSLNEFRGHVDQEYPPYSSKTVDGKALFSWARAGTLSSIVMPRKSVTVYDIEIEAMYKLSEKTLLNYIETHVNKVNGDFRQDQILQTWERYLPNRGGAGAKGVATERNFPCATIKISCSSGVYARSIAHGLGADLGVPALALHILRTKVGDYSSDKSIK